MDPPEHIPPIPPVYFISEKVREALHDVTSKQLWKMSGDILAEGDEDPFHNLVDIIHNLTDKLVELRLYLEDAIGIDNHLVIHEWKFGVYKRMLRVIKSRMDTLTSYLYQFGLRKPEWSKIEGWITIKTKILSAVAMLSHTLIPNKSQIPYSSSDLGSFVVSPNITQGTVTIINSSLLAHVPYII